MGEDLKKFFVEADDGTHSVRLAHTIRFFMYAPDIKVAYEEAIVKVKSVNPAFKTISVTEIQSMTAKATVTGSGGGSTTPVARVP